MKKIFQLIVLSILIASCNSKSDSKGSTEKTDSTGTKTVAENKIIRLEPSAVDVNTPINAIEANYQIKSWDRKKIEVAGYGFVFYGDSLESKTGLSLTDSLGGRKKLVDCRFINPPSLAKIAKTDMIHIRGKVRGDFFGAVTLDSCEIIAVTKSIPTQTAYPFDIRVMNANSLSADYYKWEGKEISIIGDYSMTTTSTNSYGKSIRVDLINWGKNEIVASCFFKEDPTVKIRVNEKGVIIKGKIKSSISYYNLMMEDCSLVNR